MLKSFSKKFNNVLNDQIGKDEQFDHLKKDKKKKRDIEIEDPRPGYGPYQYLPYRGEYFTPYDIAASQVKNFCSVSSNAFKSKKELQSLWFTLGSLMRTISKKQQMPKNLDHKYWSGDFNVEQLIGSLKSVEIPEAKVAVEIVSRIQKLQNNLEAGVIKSFHKYSAPRWTQEEIELLKNTYIEQRNNNISHNQIYQTLSEIMDRSYRSIKQKLEALYQVDEDLKQYKYDSWSREKIIDTLKQTYVDGEPLNRMYLHKKLRFQIANHSQPKCTTRGFTCWFESFDHAIAEAILEVGFERNGQGSITEIPITSLDEALWYYRRAEKKSHRWTEDEIVSLFRLAHRAGLPLTHQFFAAHPDIYKPLLGVNRSLEGIDDTIELLGKTWGDLVIKAVPGYQNWYDESGNAKRSTGEIRVQRFLDLNRIPYRIPTGGDKIPVTDSELQLLGYKNFIPDFFIVDDSGRDLAVVEVFGSVADSQASNGQVADEYNEKIQAKINTFQQLPYDFIAVHDNSRYGSDLADQALHDKFSRYIPVGIVG